MEYHEAAGAKMLHSILTESVFEDESVDVGFRAHFQFVFYYMSDVHFFITEVLEKRQILCIVLAMLLNQKRVLGVCKQSAETTSLSL